MDGPFAVEESASLNRPFSQQHRDWVSRLLADQVQTTRYRAVRSQIFNLLQVRDFAGIRQLLSEEQLRQQGRERAHQLPAHLFNIEVETHQIHTSCASFQVPRTQSSTTCVTRYCLPMRRIFDSGVAEFLFPKDIFQLDMIDLREWQVARFRNRSA